MRDQVLAEARRLYKLGFAIHWLHNKSKRPIESAWTSGPRKTWAELKESYQPGYNVGVRLGETSKIGGGFLGAIDVDVKSTDAKHAKEAAAALRDLTKGQKLPEVKSGRGNGSKHYYVVTPEPLTPHKLLTSKEIIKVPMPSVAPSKRELNGYGDLTDADIKKGLRARPAWEIGIMGQGQQVVLPPSIHPDSGKSYAWQSDFEPETAKPKKFNIALSSKPAETTKEITPTNGVTKTNEKFQFSEEPVDIFTLPVHERIVDMILSGEGVEDRSASLLPISAALLKAGLNQNQILTVLTDPSYYIGETGYHHAQTNNRARAAYWVFKYSLKKVLKEKSAAAMFAEPYEEPEELSFDEMAADDLEAAEDDWKLELDYTDRGAYRATLKNIVDILAHEVGPNFVRRDLFAFRDAYAFETPWGGVEGAAITDDDMVMIKVWLARNWGIEPSVYAVSEALSIISVNNSYDPVIEWLEALPPWDEVERLDTWLFKNFGVKKSKRIGTEEYHAQVFRKWIFGMVLRAYQPGAHFPWIPIFEGKQGVGKSSFGRILVGEKYFLDWLPDLGDKDASLSLQGSWAVEMPELASMRKNEIEVVKGFLTRKIDKFRPPHGRKTIESPRRCVFFGTTNNATYLKDDSGNRRFKPIEVGKLNFNQLAKDRDQLFAEALWLYRSGFETEKTVELSEDAKLFEADIQKEKMVQDEADLMAEEIVHFYTKQKESPDDLKFDFNWFSTRDLFAVGGVQGPIQKWKYDARNVQFLAKALKKLGATKHHTERGNRWKLVLKDDE